MEKWEYLVVPMEQAGGLEKTSEDLRPERLNDWARRVGRLWAFRSRRAISSLC